MKKNSIPSKTSKKIFKQCPCCNIHWKTKNEFLADTSLHLAGYQWNRKQSIATGEITGILLFTHRLENCGTTLAIYPSSFKNKKP